MASRETKNGKKTIASPYMGIIALWLSIGAVIASVMVVKNVSAVNNHDTWVKSQLHSDRICKAAIRKVLSTRHWSVWNTAWEEIMQACFYASPLWKKYANMIMVLIESQQAWLRQEWLTGYLLGEDAWIEWMNLAVNTHKWRSIDTILSSVYWTTIQDTVRAIEHVTSVYASRHVARLKDIRQDLYTVYGKLWEKNASMIEEILQWTQQQKNNAWMQGIDNVESKEWQICLDTTSSAMKEIRTIYEEKKEAVSEMKDITDAMIHDCNKNVRLCLAQRERLLNPIDTYWTNLSKIITKNNEGVKYIWTLVTSDAPLSTKKDALLALCENGINATANATADTDTDTNTNTNTNGDNTDNHVYSQQYDDQQMSYDKLIQEQALKNYQQKALDALHYLQSLQSLTQEIQQSAHKDPTSLPAPSGLPTLFERQLQEIRAQQESYYWEIQAYRLQENYDPLLFIEEYFSEFFGDTSAVTY